MGTSFLTVGGRQCSTFPTQPGGTHLFIPLELGMHQRLIGDFGKVDGPRREVERVKVHGSKHLKLEGVARFQRQPTRSPAFTFQLQRGTQFCLFMIFECNIAILQYLSNKFILSLSRMLFYTRLRLVVITTTHHSVVTETAPWARAIEGRNPPSC